MRKNVYCLLFSVLLILPTAATAQVALSGVPARAIGQDSLTTGAVNLVEGREFDGPIAVALDTSVSPAYLYVSDLLNNRVLGFKNASSFANGQKADLVIGQLDFVSTSRQGPGVATSSGGRSTGLTEPTGLVTDAKGNLYIVDTGNNRILRFPTPFAHSTQFPDLVIGQTSFNTNGANTGGASAKTLQFNNGSNVYVAYLAFDPQGNLWVADAGNNRVLRYPAASIGSGATNGPAADIVLGQTDFVTTTYNNPSGDPTSLNAINEPTGIVFDNEGRLYVAESASSARGRILIYNGAFSIGLPASRLIGVVPSTVSPQPPSISEQQIGPAPGNLFLINDGIAICDSANNRILVYPPASQFTTNTLTQQAVAVIGQKNFSVGAANQGQPQTDASSLASPQAAFATATQIYIADTGNSRVIVVPYTGSGAATVFNPATLLLGQDQFYLNAPNLVEGKEFNFSSANAGLVIDTSANPPHLYVADPSNNRILGFKDIRSVTFGAKADLVIGQPDFQRTLVNYPSGDPTKPNANGLYFPIGLALDSAGNLYVADRGNGRVVRFASPFANPTTLPAANLVLGQFSLTGPTITDASANTMSAPTGLAFAHNNGLLVSDSVHNRVLYFAGAAASFTNGMAATKVFGQPNFTSTVASTSTSSPGNRFNSPHGIATDVDDQLYVADTVNNRIAIFGRVYLAGTDPVPVNSLVSITFSSSVSVAITTPVGVYVNPVTDEIWVADTGAGSMVRFPNFNNLAVNSFAPNFVISDGGASPLSLAQDAYGDLFTADTANRVAINFPTFSTLNAASFYPSLALAPGAIGSIFGFTNQFATTAQSASALPLPTALQNVEVLVNGTPAPLFYLGNSQINFQVPSSTPTTGSVEVTIERTDTGQILGDSYLAMNTVAPALFTLNSSGQGQVVALNQDNTVNGPTNPAANGTVIQFFGTGQGIVPNQPADGTAATGLSPTPYIPQVIIGSAAANNPLPAANVQYSGLAPGLVGVWQINALIPSTVAPTASSPGQQTRVGIVVNGNSSTGIAGATLVTTIWVKQPGT